MSDPHDRTIKGDGTPDGSVSPSSDLAHPSEIVLNSYLDGEATAEEVTLVEAHLRSCPTCQESLSELRGLTLLMKSLPAPVMRRSYQLPPEFARSKNSVWERLSSLLLPALPALRAATVAVILLFVAVTIRNSVSETGVTDETAMVIPAVSSASTTATAAQPDSGRNSAQMESNQLPPTVETTVENADSLAIGGAAPAAVPSEESSDAEADDALSQSAPAESNSTTSDTSASSSSAFSSEPAAPVTAEAPAAKVSGDSSADSAAAGDEESGAADTGLADESSGSSESESAAAESTGGGGAANSTFGESVPSAQESSTQLPDTFTSSNATAAMTSPAPLATPTIDSSAARVSPIATPVIEESQPAGDRDQGSIWNVLQLLLGVAATALLVLLFFLHIRQRRYSK